MALLRGVLSCTKAKYINLDKHLTRDTLEFYPSRRGVRPHKRHSDMARIVQFITLCLLAIAALKSLLSLLSVKDIYEASGPLGIAASLLVFLLTRWERRPRLNFLVTERSARESIECLSPQGKSVRIVITNLSIDPIQIDFQSLTISCKNHSFSPCSDAPCIYETERPTLPPSGQCTIELSFDIFLELLKLDPPESHNERTFNKQPELVISVKASGGRFFTSRRNHYEEESGKFSYL